MSKETIKPEENDDISMTSQELQILSELDR